MSFLGDKNTATTGSLVNTGEINAPVVIDNSINNNTYYISLPQSGSISSPNNSELFRDIDPSVQSAFDFIKEDVDEGRVESSLKKLETLHAREKDRISKELLLKIETLIAHCNVQLGNHALAAKQLSNTYLAYPANPKAAANKVFSLILNNEYDTALNFGIENIAKDNNNSSLVYYTILSAQFVDNVLDLEGIIPEEVGKHPSVMLATIFFLRSRNNKEWIDYAISAFKLHKENSDLKWQNAEAQLTEVVIDINESSFLNISRHNKEQTQKIFEVLFERWSFIKRSQIKFKSTDHLSLTHNVLTILEIIENMDALNEIGEYLINEEVGEQSLYIHLGQVCSRYGLFDVIEKIKSKIPPENYASHQFSRMLNRLEYDKLAQITEENLSQYPDFQRQVIKAASFFAKKKQEKKLSDADIISYANSSTDLHGKLILSNLAFLNGYIDAGETLFNQSREAYDDSARNYLYLLATIAINTNKFRDFIEITQDKIHKDIPSEWLHKLSSAYANDYPVRTDAAAFFDSLPQEILNLPEYAYCAGVFYLKFKQPKKAVALLENSFVTFHDDLLIFALLAQQYQIDGQFDKFTSLIEGVNIAALNGRPEDKTGIIPFFKNSPKLVQAIDFAYKALEENFSNEQAIVNYLHSFFFFMKDYSPEPLKQVACDCYVTAKNDAGEIFSFLISEDGLSNIFDKSFKLNDEFSKKVLGLKKEDSFTLRGLIDETEWKICELESKYTAAIQICLEDFNKKFPTSFNLNAMQPGDDFEELKRLLKKIDDRDKLVEEAYKKNHIPLAILAKMKGTNSIALADGLRGRGIKIATCIGTYDERNSAYRLITQHAQKGVTIDSYTAFICSHLDIFHEIEAVFGQIFVAGSCLNALYSIANRFYPFEEHMTAGYENDKISVITTSAEQSEKLYNHFRGLAEKIKNSATAVNVPIPNNISAIEENIVTTLSPSCIDDIYIAQLNSTILLSEDMYYRGFASTVISKPVDSTWLQPVLIYALANEFISTEKFLKAFIGLAHFRHDYLSATAPLLFEIFEIDTTENLDDFEVVVDYLGTQNADVQSHFDVAIAFLAKLWKHDTSLKKRKATGILLRKLTRLAAWEDILIAIIQCGNRELNRYIAGWMKGHFLKFSKKLPWINTI